MQVLDRRYFCLRFDESFIWQLLAESDFDQNKNKLRKRKKRKKQVKVSLDKILHVELLKVAKDIFENIGDEISDKEAIKIIADWSVAISSTRIPVWTDKTKTKLIWISATEKWNISKPLGQVFIWTH